MQGLLQTEVQDTRAASPEDSTALLTSTRQERNAMASNVPSKGLNKGFSSETGLRTTKDIAHNKTDIGTLVTATDPDRATGKIPI